MFKIIGFELKKIVSRPGIYILAVLLAVLLCVSAFIYNPKEKEIDYQTLDGATVIEVATDFNLVHKPMLDTSVNVLLTDAKAINNKSASDYEQEILTKLNNFLNTCTTYSDIANSAGTTESSNNSNLQAIHNNIGTGSLDVLYSTIKSYLGNTDNSYFKIAILNEDFANMDTEITSLKSKITATINSKDYLSFANELTYLSKNVKNLVNTIHYPDYSNVIEKFIESGNYYSVTIERQSVVLNKMSELTNNAKNDPDFNTNKIKVNEFNDLFNEYRILSNIYETLFKTTTNIALMESFDVDDVNKIRYLDNHNYYSQKELNTRYTYYIENDTNENLYASALSFDFTSNPKANGYDYTYFAMSIFSMVLIVFAVMLASHSIAGETKEGTMRFVAIRPVSRTSVILGKFVAIALITFIMMVFSGMVSFIVGGFVFGINSYNILSIINSSTVLVIHPMLSIVIYLASIYLQLLVYVSIAMMLTSFIKSDLFTFVITILIYIANMMLPIFFGTTSWLKFNPFTSLNLYAFAGGGTIVSDTMLGKMFTPAVYMGGSIGLSLVFILSFIVIFNTIAVFRFKKREL